MKITKAALVPVVAAALLTAGCSSSEQTAAEVGTQKVSSSDVQVLSEMQCTLVKGSPQQQGPVPSRALRDASLDALVRMEVVGQLLASHHATDFNGQALRQQVQGADQALKAMPADERERALDILTEYTKRELQLQQLAVDQLNDQGVSKPSQQQIEDRRQKLVEDYRKSIDVDISPAFSPDDKGRIGAEDGSLSVPVSSYAKQAGQQQPDASFVANLPKSMRCG